MTLLAGPDEKQTDTTTPTYDIRLLLADREPNTTSQGLAQALQRFPRLVYLDLSYTSSARDRIVLSTLTHLEHLQVLKLQGVGLKDKDVEYLGKAVGIRTRLLDLRDNHLTDAAVQSLLRLSFLSPDGSSIERDTESLGSPHLDGRFRNLLSRPWSANAWIEGLPHTGITHLYIADNYLTIDGAANLLSSNTLHVLDVTTIRSALMSQETSVVPSHCDRRGAEKLIPFIGLYAKENLTWLRVDHAVVTADAPLKDMQRPNPVFDTSGISVFEGSPIEENIPWFAIYEDERALPPKYTSPATAQGSQDQKIYELLAKRPGKVVFPRRDGKDGRLPYLHPSNIPHLESLTLTDVPSHVRANSPLLANLIRFITACSNEALLATLQAGTDYSLPPGQARKKAERQRACSLFALRHLVLEITPVFTPNESARLTAWKSENAHTGYSSTGDRDSENLWTAAADDFSFFGDSDNSDGRIVLTADDEDSVGSRTPTTGAMVDVVAELSAFRRRKKTEYERHVREIAAPLSGSVTSASGEAMAMFMEGHWKGEIKVVRK